MQTVATGVAIGIATGVAKIAFNLDLWYLLVPLHDSHVNHFPFK